MPAGIGSVIQDSREFVTDSIWLGRVNNIRNSLALNSPDNPLARTKADELLSLQNDRCIMALYATFKDDPIIKFKDSIKKVVGLERPTQKGLDV